MKISDILISLADLFLAETCPVCRTNPIKSAFPVCPACHKNIVEGPFLKTESTYFVKEIHSCRPYAGGVKECVRQFKFRGKTTLLAIFENLIRSYITSGGRSTLADVELIIPVPISWDHYRQRGYNQSELFARIIKEIIDLPMATDNLLKSKNTPSQTGLKKKERMENLRGSFSCRRTDRIKNKSILLVDDVMTTGATIDCCAEELLGAGASKITGFTLARTPLGEI